MSSGLAQHLAGEVTTLASCWKIIRRDGVVLGFTDHVRDLEVDGVTYKAASGYSQSTGLAKGAGPVRDRSPGRYFG